MDLNMKKFLPASLLIIVFSFNTQLFAEGSGKGGDDFRKTAASYEEKSEKYRAKGMTEVANLYSRQAEIKREAAAMGDEGRWDEINWSEYHKNEGLINEKVNQTNNKHESEKKLSKKGGDEFRKTAESYDNNSEMYRAKGKIEIASLYSRQADIKHKAAKLADDGLWDEIDWTEYYANEARINRLTNHGKAKHAKK